MIEYIFFNAVITCSHKSECRKTFKNYYFKIVKRKAEQLTNLFNKKIDIGKSNCFPKQIQKRKKKCLGFGLVKYNNERKLAKSKFKPIVNSCFSQQAHSQQFNLHE